MKQKQVWGKRWGCLKGNSTSFHLVGDELIPGGQPGFHTPASPNAQSPSSLPGVAGAWLCSLQWPQDLLKDSWDLSSLMEGLRGPFWALGEYTYTKLGKKYFEAHRLPQWHSPRGPPQGHSTNMHFKQRPNGLQRPTAPALLGHPCCRVLSGQKKTNKQTKKHDKSDLCVLTEKDIQMHV